MRVTSLLQVTDIERMGALIPPSRVAIYQRGSRCILYDDQETYVRDLLQFTAAGEAGTL